VSGVAAWWEIFNGYLTQITKATEIGLNYVYRPHQNMTNERCAKDYDTNDDHYYIIIILEEAHSKDNKCIYVEWQFWL
jgi:hypothetical protein